MPGVDERIREALRALAEPADPAGAFERVSARRARRRTVRRLQAATLAVVVLAGTGAGTFVLARVFGASDRPGARLGPALPANGAIAYVSLVGRRQQVFLLDADRPVRITHDDRDYSDLAWSPDGTRLAATVTLAVTSGGTTSLEPYRIVVMNADGTGLREITNGGATVSDPRWSPDGSRILFSAVRERSPACSPCHADLYVMNADGTGLTRLTRSPGRDGSADWSPDGTRLAFVRSTGRHSQIARNYVMRADGSDLVPLLRCRDGPCPEGQAPRWSPDGTRLALCCGGGQRTTISLVRAGGILVRELSTCRGGHCIMALHVTWSPDGRFLLFDGIDTRDDTGRTEAYTMHPDGTGLALRVPGACCAAWQPVPARPGGRTPGEPSGRGITTPTTGASAACRATTVAGDFDGDGRPDRATIERASCSSASTAAPSSGRDGFAVEVRYASGASGVWPLPACGETCAALAAPDLDADGAAEFLVTVEQGASSRFLEAYRLPASERGPVRLTVLPPGSPSHPGGRPVRFEWGGSVTHQRNLRCRATGKDVHLLATAAALSRDARIWSVVLTDLVLGRDGFGVASERSISVPAGTPQARALFATDTVCGAPADGGQG